MQPVESNHVDKSEWPHGPWMNEPDRIEWRDESTGYPCLIVRAQTTGALCGYVAVPPGHPFHGVAYNEEHSAAELLLSARMDQPLGDAPGMMLMLSMMSGDVPPRLDNAVQVHGGLTFSGKCSGKICHVAQPGEPDDVWWLGFDCSHSGDQSPAMMRHFRSMRGFGEQYRSVDYVRHEVAILAEQLQQVAKQAVK